MSVGPLKNTSKKKIWLMFSFVIILFLILVATVWGIGVYRYQWDDPITRKMLSVVPFPAFIVEGNVITMNQFYEQLDILSYFSDAIFASAPSGVSAFNENDKREAVESKIIKDQLIKLYLRENGIVLSQQDVDRKFQEILSSDLDEEEIRQAVGSTYGTSLEKFQTYFIEPLARLEKAQKFLQDSPITSEIRTQAENAQADIVSKKISFDQAARTLSKHSSSVDGGDLGYFVRGERLPLLEDDIFALSIGEISPVLATDTGFHLVFVEDKKEVEVDGQKQEQIRIRYIFWPKPTVEDWLEKARSEKRIWSFVR